MTGALAALLGEWGIGLTACTEQGKCPDLLRTRHWRFLVIDAGADPACPLNVLSQSRRVRPDVPVLVLVQQGDTQTAVRAIKAGAADCLEIPIRPAALHTAVAALEAQANCPAHHLWMRLTPVEQIILRHILDSHTNRQIADLLSRSPRTIEVHRRHIMAKLEAANFVELVKQALRAGLVDLTGAACGQMEDTPDPYHVCV